MNKQGSDLRIDGRGRYVTLMIARVSDDANRPEVLYMATRFGGCMRRGCQPTKDAVLDSDGGGVLEPGDYRLYVVADGAPIRIMWKLQGLRGRATFSPTHRIDAEIKSPKPLFDDESGQYFSSGVTYDPPGVGVYDAIVWARTTALGAEYSWCGYEGPQPEDRAEAFSPQYCALHDDQGSQPSSFPPSGTDSIRYYSIGTDYGMVRRLQSAGHWFRANAPIERAGSTHVFISFRTF